MQSLQVYVVFDFPGVPLDSQMADDIVENITAQTVTWRDEWRALPAFSGRQGESRPIVWVDEVTEIPASD